VAILQTIGTVLVYFLLRDAMNEPEAKMILAALCGAAVVFYLLAFWARRNPLPAAIVGLVLIVTLWVADALLDPAAATRGIIIKIIIVVVLIRAIRAGVQHRQLKQQLQDERGP
jgi:hypothetical protein